MRSLNLNFIIILLLLLFGCRSIYSPPAVQTGVSNLVVEGLINSGHDSTLIKLSRTQNLLSHTVVKPETSAMVTVEGSDNSSYLLKEREDGSYASVGPLNLNNAVKYRVRIITIDHKTYLSDFTEVKESPPIDSVYYKLDANGAHIYADTHDATNRSRYYRYEYVETWVFHSAYSSAYVIKNNTIVERTPADPDVFTCWRDANSTDVLLASSAKLTRDVIFQAPVTAVPAPSQKLRIRYSILVKQYALTEDAFNFWQLVKKTTEELGSIFDPQPSQINGNIHNINNLAEPVFGYISAGTVQQKRIFIDRANLPAGWGTDDPYKFCAFLDTTQVKNITPGNYGQFFDGTFMPVTEARNPVTQAFIGYIGVIRPCVDCRLQGTTTKPSFW